MYFLCSLPKSALSSIIFCASRETIKMVGLVVNQDFTTRIQDKERLIQRLRLSQEKLTS